MENGFGRGSHVTASPKLRDSHPCGDWGKEEGFLFFWKTVVRRGHPKVPFGISSREATKGELSAQPSSDSLSPIHRPADRCVPVGTRALLPVSAPPPRVADESRETETVTSGRQAIPYTASILATACDSRSKLTSVICFWCRRRHRWTN